MKSYSALTVLLVSLAVFSASPGRCDGWEGGAFETDASITEGLKNLTSGRTTLFCQSVQAGNGILSRKASKVSQLLAESKPDSVAKADVKTTIGTEQMPAEADGKGSAKPVAKAVGEKNSPQVNIKQAFDELETLFKNYYTDAKITRTPDKLHVEYKLHKYEFHRSGTRVAAPKLGGILCDISVMPGRYTGKEVLPLQTNEPLYVILLLAPYSERDNSHLLTRLVFPPTCSADFLKEFKELLNNYFQYGRVTFSEPN